MSEIIAYRCKFVWTMQKEAPFIENGMVVVNKGIVVDVGKFSDLKKVYPSNIIKDRGDISLVPGLINIHTHLELSHLYRKTKLGYGFAEWVKSLIPWLVVPITKKRIRGVLKELKKSGTVAIGDITSRRTASVYQLLNDEQMKYILFVEFLGRKKNLKFPKKVNPLKDRSISITAHSPYSTTEELLIKCKKWTNKHKRPFAIHLAESEEEVELLTTGKGKLAPIIKPLLGKSFTPPMMHPVDYLDRLNVLDQNTLAIHCVHLMDKHIKKLKERGCSVCICPRSNFFIGVGRAKWEKMYEAGISLCIGTDGLCSNEDLNLWNELEFLINTSKIELSLYEFLKMITINPAKTANLDSVLGTISSGKKALFSTIPKRIEELFKTKRYT